MEKVQQASDEWEVPSAYLDFGMPPRGEERPQEAFTALLMLRRQLAGQGESPREDNAEDRMKE